MAFWERYCNKGSMVKRRKINSEKKWCDMCTRNSLGTPEDIVFNGFRLKKYGHLEIIVGLNF